MNARETIEQYDKEYASPKGELIEVAEIHAEEFAQWIADTNCKPVLHPRLGKIWADNHNTYKTTSELYKLFQTKQP